MTKKEKYKLFCEQEKQIPLFSQYWWMEAVAQDQWDVLLYEKDNHILASMVYFLEQKNGSIKIGKAPLTQNNGIYIKYPSDMKMATKLNYEETVMNGIIDQIEKLPIERFEQNFNYRITNWLPFYWKGYQETTRYTYVIEDTSNLDKVKANFTAGLRWDIKQASKQLTIKYDIPNEEFYTVNEMTFQRQNKKIPYSRELFYSIDKSARQKDACKSIGAYDTEGRLIGVAYFVWDDSSVYYLLSGSNPEFRNIQPQTLCIVEGLNLAHKLGKKFDFEGSMIQPIEHAVRKFGGIQKPYYRIFKNFS